MSRILRRIAAATAVPVLALGLAACSSGGDAASADSLEKQTRTWDAAFDECVRDAGFDLDDPEFSEGGSGDADRTLEAGGAIEACAASTSDDLGPRPVSDSQQAEEDEIVAELTKVQECLQEHGIEAEGAEDGVFAVDGDVPPDVAADCDAEEYLDPDGGDR